MVTHKTNFFIFVEISDNLPVVRQARADPNLTKEESDAVADKWRNHVSAISTVFSNIGFLILTGKAQLLLFMYKYAYKYINYFVFRETPSNNQIIRCFVWCIVY
jgi:hypothetical protein